MDYSPWGQKESDMTEQLSLSEPSMGFPESSVDKESTCSVGDLGWEDPLEKGMATRSSILAWRIPWTIVHGVTKSQT